MSSWRQQRNVHVKIAGAARNAAVHLAFLFRYHCAHRFRRCDAQMDFRFADDLAVRIGLRRRNTLFPGLCVIRINHVGNRAAHFRVGQIGRTAARWHRSVPLDRRADRHVESLREPRYPGVAVADFGRAAYAVLVTLAAPFLDDLLAAAFGRCGPSVNRFGPVSSGLVDHVGDSAFDFEVGDIQVTAVRRHLPYAADRVLRQAGQALRSAR